MSRPATEIQVNGIVQGVGFRPFVYNQARKLQLVGHITNRSDGVVITVAGDDSNIASLVEILRHDAPPLARIISLEQRKAILADDIVAFSIIDSVADRKGDTHVSPDISTCKDCLDEILDPVDRRHKYPFTNCTNCGPRYTIIRTLPYDRPRTTMDVFTMCPACEQEYKDPANRRFHAQPNACPVCGPQLEWLSNKSNLPVTSPAKPLEQAIHALVSDKIIGIKGLGGFHLAVNAFSTKAIEQLRNRKNRPVKPLAVMVKDIETAKRLCDFSPEAEKLLSSITCPIVLLRRKPDSGLADNLARDINELGVMLPYTPLHHLLFRHPDTPSCLVMTSGNVAGEPLCKDNDDAIEKLGTFCDGFLMHNRVIHTRIDDSVVRLIGDQQRFLRRARGYAPLPIRLTNSIPSVLAVGAELKNCFCLTRKQDAFMSQHIGDFSNLSTQIFFEQTYERLKDLLEIDPETVVADLHPDYLSTRFAKTLNLPIIQVQHHWAHAASVMAEHGLEEVLAIILDGTGYGPDRTVWGGEVLHCTLTNYKRLGRLSHLALPGGDKAAKQPWRMALSALSAAKIDSPETMSNLAAIGNQEKEFILEMINKDVNCPRTSSCGRLFDAVSSLLGICHYNTFEGQAAMQLEAEAAMALGKESLLATPYSYLFDQDSLFKESNGLQEISCSEMVRTLMAKMTDEQVSVPELALFFHVFLVSAFGNMIRYLSRKTGIDTVVLSGGSVQNKILTEGFLNFFSNTHLKLYTNAQVPANDGGLALGQAVIGGAHVSGNSHAGK